MPNFGTTTIWSLRKLLGTSLASDIDAGFAALADDTDGKLTPSTQGTLSAIPTAGKVGQTYKTTDTRQLFRDNGTTWDEIPLVPLAAQTWQTVALTGFNASTPNLSYYKDSLGIVHFRGDALVVGGSNITALSTLCTLPAGYRPGSTPAAGQWFGAIVQAGAFSVTPFIITPAGVVQLGTVGMAANNTFTFGHVHFRAEN